MPEFSITRQISAPVERVWEVLDNFGGISQWNPRVKHSELTSAGPVSAGSTRHCDLTPMGGVNERIDTYIPNERMTVNIHETSKLPISNATADFSLAARDGGTELQLHYSFTLNRLGRVARGTTERQLQKGIGGLVDALEQESERVAAG